MGLNTNVNVAKFDSDFVKKLKCSASLGLTDKEKEDQRISFIYSCIGDITKKQIRELTCV